MLPIISDDYVCNKFEYLAGDAVESNRRPFRSACAATSLNRADGVARRKSVGGGLTAIELYMLKRLVEL